MSNETNKSAICMMLTFVPFLVLWGLFAVLDATNGISGLEALLMLIIIIAPVLSIPIGMVFAIGTCIFSLRALREGSYGFEKILNYFLCGVGSIQTLAVFAFMVLYIWN